MDFCRNVSVSSGLPSEYPPEQVLSPPCSKLGGLTGSLDDLFSGQNTEVDVSLEWLSIFVEDCLSSTGNCLPAPINLENTSTTPDFNPSKPLQQLRQKPQQTIPPPSLQKFVIPSKGARSKRKRGGTTGKSKTPLNSWAHHLNLESQTLILQGMMTSSSSDPPLLQQAYWLADSELIHEAPKPKPKLKPKPKMEEEEEEEEEDRGRVGDDEEEVERKEELVEEEEEEEEESLEGNDDNNNNNNNNVNGEANANANGNGIAIASRRCSHCLAQRTPQWRAGPLGPKTLCNACGVRYKSGRLLPEYRPAKSPSFVSYLHSNSHKKVLEMRNMATTTLPSSSISP